MATAATWNLINKIDTARAQRSPRFFDFGKLREIKCGHGTSHSMQSFSSASGVCSSSLSCAKERRRKTDRERQNIKNTQNLRPSFAAYPDLNMVLKGYDDSSQGATASSSFLYTCSHAQTLRHDKHRPREAHA